MIARDEEDDSCGERQKEDRRSIILKAVDIGYSYHLAKKMEEFKSNPVLGYRTAGSKAEFVPGNF